MSAHKQWKYSEIEKVLTDKRPVADVAREIGRSISAIRQVRTMATVVKSGKGQYLSGRMRTDLQRFFTNHGNMQLKEHQAPVEQAPVESKNTEDTCAQQMDTLVQEAEKTFALLQEQMSKLARLQAVHQTHSIVTTYEELKNSYELLEKEVSELREFKKNAEQRGFGKMLRGAIPF